MGWTYSNHWPTRAKLLEYLRAPERFAGHARLLKSSAVGNHHWYVIELQDGRRVVCVDLMAGGGRRHGWGYKDLGEDAGPVACDCPLSLLAIAGEAAGGASAWRERVRDYHRRRALRPKPSAGLVVRYGDRRYRLLEPASARRGWRVLCLDDGGTYRMKARQLSAALDELAEAGETQPLAA